MLASVDRLDRMLNLISFLPTTPLIQCRKNKGFAGTHQARMSADFQYLSPR